MSVASDPKQNRLLAALPEDEWQHWRPELEWVRMSPGEVLYESGRALTHVHFPTSGVVSLLCTTEAGSAAEVAVAGHEGMVGLPTFMGGESSPSTAVVHSGGQGFRLNSHAIKQAFNRSDAVAHLFLCNTQALIAQIARTTLCNRQHPVEQRLCRWLLLTFDRLHGTDLVITPDLVSRMLGARRDELAAAALALHRAGLIRDASGRIAATDRAGLEQRTCGCYAMVRQAYERLLPDTRLAA